MRNRLTLYHGSTEIIEKPLYGFGREDNDFGRGFYCTEDLELAKEWGCRDGSDGFANAYTIDTEGLRILDLDTSPYTLLNWAAILAEHRKFDLTPVGEAGRKFLLENFLVDVSEYDIVCGYRADDSYFLYTSDFLNGSIPFKLYSSAMHLGNLGRQVVLKSRKAFDRICYKGNEPAETEIYSFRFKNRENAANNRYTGMSKEWKYNPEEILMSDIIAGRVGLDDPRIQ